MDSPFVGVVIVDRNENGIAIAVTDGGSFLERNKGVAGARHAGAVALFFE